MSVRILGFNVIHSVIKFTKVQLPPMGPVRNGIFYFGYFSTKLGTSIDGHENIII
jgi:hypothetical protein